MPVQRIIKETVARVRIGKVVVWGEKNRPHGAFHEVSFIENGGKCLAAMRLEDAIFDGGAPKGFVYRRNPKAEWWNRYA